jgi:hypothetical protein
VILHVECGFHTHESNFDMYAFKYDTHECVNDMLECSIYTQSAILYAECDFHTQCDFETHECDYDTHNCDFYTYKSDFDTYECDYNTHECNLYTNQLKLT